MYLGNKPDFELKRHAIPHPHGYDMGCSGEYIFIYRQTSDISHTLVDNKIVDHSDVVGAAPAAPTTSSFST